MFDGEDVAARLSADPEQRFFVDLREDVVYEFDQSEAEIDFSAFDLQCPSMRFPVELLGWMETGAVLDTSLTQQTWFSVARWEGTAEDSHRISGPPMMEEYLGDGCWLHCDGGGEDCVECCAGS